MSNRPANDDRGAQGSLAAGWSDVWAGVLLTLFLLGNAIIVAVLFSGPNPSLSNEDGSPAAYTAASLQGVRDPARPGWRTGDGPWNLMGIHMMTANVEGKGRGQATDIGVGGERP
jgi:hypothetical protein